MNEHLPKFTKEVIGYEVGLGLVSDIKWFVSWLVIGSDLWFVHNNIQMQI